MIKFREKKDIERIREFVIILYTRIKGVHLDYVNIHG